MEQLSGWVGAGLVTAGVSAALIAGAGVATADSGTGSDSAGSASSAGSAGSEASEASTKTATTKTTTTKTTTTKTSTKDDPTNGDTNTPPKTTVGSGSSPNGDTKTDGNTKTDAEDEKAPEPEPEPELELDEGPAAGPTVDETPVDRDHGSKREPTTEQKTSSVERTAPVEQAAPTGASTPAPEPEPTAPVDVVTKTVAYQELSVRPMQAMSPVAPPAAVTPELPPVLAFVASVVGSVVTTIGSAVFSVAQAVEALVTGPPLLPPGSTVTVRTSTVQLSTGQRVEANWYFPAGDEPPKTMILLQHGFFALGPMYSYTAATLAERTDSVVVTTTLTSNPFAGDSFWLGGTGTARSIADLFGGDREALAASAADAGFLTRYGAGAVLPQKFALAGHSLGANLVSAAAGFLADSGDAKDLVGVILLDGVPYEGTLPTALAKLAAFQTETGHYVPVREIGAPPNLFNSTSTVNQDLAAARPDRFNGVVLDGGVHMDSMRGGNDLVQFVAYLVAGFPQPQNPPAVTDLAVDWLDHWFAGDTTSGDGLLPGSTIDIPTAQGTARGVVIGTPPATVLPRLVESPVTFPSSSPSDIPEVNPTLSGVAA